MHSLYTNYHYLTEVLEKYSLLTVNHGNIEQLENVKELENVKQFDDVKDAMDVIGQYFTCTDCQLPLC